MSPAAVGAAATISGDISKAAAPLIKNPATTVLVTKALVLTKEKAREFLKKAKGNKEQAIQDSIKAGYDPYQ